jgi:predicted nucleic acid-binding protein
MTLGPVVLDAAALSMLASPTPGGPSAGGPSSFVRALLTTAAAQQRRVLVPAVVCAETCRGTARTRAVEALLSRHQTGKTGYSPIEIVDTNIELAKLVGLTLHASQAGSEDIVDAHVVATCVQHGGGLIITSDPLDMERLKTPFVGVRIVVRGLNRPT